MLPSRVRAKEHFTCSQEGLQFQGVERENLAAKTVDFIKQNLKFNNVIHFTGETGSGKTQFVNFVLTLLVDKGVYRKEDILFLTSPQGCSPKSLLRFFAQDYPRTDVDVLSEITVLRKAHFEPQNQSVRAAIKNLLLPFRIICIDDVGFDDIKSMWSYLMDVVRELHTEEKSLKKYFTFMSTSNVGQLSSDIFSDIEAAYFQVYHHVLPSLREAEAFQCASLYFQEEVIDDNLKRLIRHLKGSPGAIRTLMYIVKYSTGQNLPENMFVKVQTSYPDPITCFKIMLRYLCQSYLNVKERRILQECTHFREYFPVLSSIRSEIQRLIELGYVTSTERGDTATLVYTTPSKCQIINSVFSGTNIEAESHDLSALELWKSLLVLELQKLIEDAKNKSWAFVPEKWQYKLHVGTKERYNVKDLLFSNNQHYSRFKEIDVLEEALYHALQEKNYNEAAGIMFLMDRFVYWQGASKEFMDLVKIIQRDSPTTALAPQIIIRKARVLKNDGDLRGAEKILDQLLAGNSSQSSWPYKTKADMQVQTAVCIQIKGDIARGLGFWLDACRLLLKTVQLFKEVEPNPDKKGWASSLTLVAYALQYISQEDFGILAKEYRLEYPHPILQAIQCVQEAADLCVYSPQFYAKNKRIAGEMNFMYAKILQDPQQQRKYLLRAAHELREGLSCHSSIALLESREQYYEFVYSIQRFAELCLAGVQDHAWKAKGEKLLQVSLHLYEHYCNSPKVVKHTEESILLIQTGLRLVKLPTIPVQEKVEVNEEGVLDVKVKAPEELQVKDEKNDGLSVDERAADTIPGTIGYEPLAEEDAAKNYKADDVSSESDLKEKFRLYDTVEESIDLTETKFREATTVDTVETKENSHTDFLNAGQQKNPGLIRAMSTIVPFDESVKAALDRLEKFEDGNTKGQRNAEHSPSTETREREIRLRMQDTEATVGTIQEDNGVEEVVQKLVSTKTKVHRARVAIFDATVRRWAYSETVAFVGDVIDSGNCRYVYNFEHLTQEELLGRYVGKQYIRPDLKISRERQYLQDVECQMIARDYAAKFNRELYKHGLMDYGQVHFIPTVSIKLLDEEEGPGIYFNVEPFLSGKFWRISNNWNYVNRSAPGCKLLLAYSHFTYEITKGEHLVVDIQGWTTDEKGVQMYLTDPQILTVKKEEFATGNIGKPGIEQFWKNVHQSCNDICFRLGLTRPK